MFDDEKGHMVFESAPEWLVGLLRDGLEVIDERHRVECTASHKSIRILQDTDGVTHAQEYTLEYEALRNGAVRIELHPHNYYTYSNKKELEAVVEALYDVLILDGGLHKEYVERFNEHKRRLGLI